MVEYGGLDSTFAALSHPLRRRMLDSLRGGPKRVTELAAPLPVSLAASSKHIIVLEDAGMIARTIEGRDHVLALEALPLAAAEDYVATYREFWQGRLAALDAHLRRRSRG